MDGCGQRYQPVGRGVLADQTAFAMGAVKGRILHVEENDNQGRMGKRLRHARQFINAVLQDQGHGTVVPCGQVFNLDGPRHGRTMTGLVGGRTQQVAELTEAFAADQGYGYDGSLTVKFLHDQVMHNICMVMIH